MKRWVCVLLCAAALAACVSRNTAERIEGEKDSLERVVRTKDSLMNEVFASVNAIAENLAAIRVREHLIASVSNSDQGMKGPTGQIDEDIAAIDELLKDNRNKIEALEKSASQLRRARVKIGSLEQMIDHLHAEIDAKDGQIVELKQNLAHLGIQVETLSERVEEQEAKVADLTAQKEQLTTEARQTADKLHTAYYAVGRQKELTELGIVEKKGFIGRTLRVKEHPELDRFTQADTRTLREIPIGQRHVTLVTMHPQGSYELRMGAGKQVETLVITDPERFWSYSKILVVSWK